MTRRNRVIGITGNIATGKTTVVDMLAELGADTIDADALVHELMGPDSVFAEPLRTAFGDSVVNPDGSIDRPALGTIVFSDADQLATLEALIHPIVVNTMIAAIYEPGRDTLVLDAIKLFEAGIADHCDEVWVVDAPLDVRVERLMERNGIDRDEAMRRIEAQPPQQDKVDRADVVIANGGPIENTHARVRDAWNSAVNSRRT